jgi:hypothetical protein
MNEPDMETILKMAKAYQKETGFSFLNCFKIIMWSLGKDVENV